MRKWAALASFGIVLGAAFGASAEDRAPDVEALRQEVKALRAEVEALRAALRELGELDARRAETLRRLGAGTGKPTTASPAPVARAPAARPPPKPARIARGTVRGRVTAPAGEPVAYVYIENVRGRAVRDERASIRQRGRRFLPDWAVIRRGTTVDFPNLDPIYHNVFSRSSGNTFDLGLYRSGEEAKAYRFMKAGVVDLYCNLHPRMIASVLVLPNRYYAKVDADGRFALEGVPAGRRKVVAWTPGTAPQSAWAEIGAEPAELTFTLNRRDRAHTNKFGQPYGSYP